MSPFQKVSWKYMYIVFSDCVAATLEALIWLWQIKQIRLITRQLKYLVLIWYSSKLEMTDITKPKFWLHDQSKFWWHFAFYECNWVTLLTLAHPVIGRMIRSFLQCCKLYSKLMSNDQTVMGISRPLSCMGCCCSFFYPHCTQVGCWWCEIQTSFKGLLALFIFSSDYISF